MDIALDGNTLKVFNRHLYTNLNEYQFKVSVEAEFCAYTLVGKVPNISACKSVILAEHIPIIAEIAKAVAHTMFKVSVEAEGEVLYSDEFTLDCEANAYAQRALFDRAVDMPKDKEVVCNVFAIILGTCGNASLSIVALTKLGRIGEVSFSTP